MLCSGYQEPHSGHVIQFLLVLSALTEMRAKPMSGTRIKIVELDEWLVLSQTHEIAGQNDPMLYCDFFCSTFYATHVS